MRRTLVFAAASAALFFARAAAAAEPALLALNTPAKPQAIRVTASLAEPATAQLKATDYDAFSVNDPLYREGSREMLKQVIKEDKEKEQAKPVLRDAPISGAPKPAKAIKKSRVKKPVHADPLKSSTL